MQCPALEPEQTCGRVRVAPKYGSSAVDIDIHPPAAPDEREAILEALLRHGDAPERPSAWWRSGVEENVEADAEREPTGR